MRVSIPLESGHIVIIYIWLKRFGQIQVSIPLESGHIVIANNAEKALDEGYAFQSP